MATFTLFDAFKQRLGDGEIDLTTSTGHTFKFMLTNTTPNVADHADKVDLTAVTGGSYADVTITHSWSETGAGTGVWRFAANADPTWTPSGTAYSTFRYVVAFDESHANDALVGYWDNGSGIDLGAGATFTLDLDANYTIFTLDG